MNTSEPIGEAADERRLTKADELLLAVLPTVTVLLVLGLVEVLSRQRLLFASLASSAFLIYLDPRHPTNAVRTLVVSQIGAAVLGLVAHLAVGPGYPAAAGAMVATIVGMILADAVHPPAVSTALAFAFRAGDEANAVLFALAVGVTAALVGIERGTLWLLARRLKRRPSAGR